MLWLVDRFGWEAAHTAPAGEIRRMLAAENVYQAHKARAQSDNWALWAQKNKRMNEILNRAMLAAEELDG